MCCHNSIAILEKLFYELLRLFDKFKHFQGRPREQFLEFKNTLKDFMAHCKPIIYQNQPKGKPGSQYHI